MITPPRICDEPMKGEQVDVIAGIPIYRFETSIPGGGTHSYFHTRCRHEPDGVWQTSTKGGATTWRWRCRICRRYYGPAVGKVNAARLVPAPRIGPSIDDMHGAEHEANEVARSYTQEAENRRKKKEEQDQVEYTQRYYQYLETAAWRIKRDRVMRRASGICEACGAARANEVHHLTYDRVFEEPLYDLVAICSPCHRRVHEIEKERRRR